MGDRPSSAKRRGGRPNRGGGRGGRGGGRGSRGGGRGGGRGGPGHGGGSGRGQGRGRGSGGHLPRKCFDDYDDDVPVTIPTYTRDDGYDDRGSHSSRPSPAAAVAPAYERPKPAPKVRLTMQHLHMSKENQEMVKDMLYNIRGEELQTKEEEEYDELDIRHDNHYWATGGQLHVDEVLNFSEGYVAQPAEGLEIADIEEKLESVAFCDIKNYNHFAVQKLVRCGFEKEQCVEALQLKDGDIGASLEYLLCNAFGIDLDREESRTRIPKKDDPVWQEAMAERQEEMMALKSIYEERFEERVPNQVWVVHLDLDHLAKLCNPDKELGAASGAGGLRAGAISQREDDRPLCLFYLKGKCRFGSRCKQRHENPSHPVSGNAPVTEEPNSKMLTKFRLEVRFPLGNMYPQEAPLVAFTSTIMNFPSHVCLIISRFLYGQAVELAEAHQPAVFSLVNFLTDDDLMVDLYNQPKPTPAALEPVICQQKKTRTEVNGGAAYQGDEDVDSGAALDSMLRMVEKDAKRQEVVEEEQVPVKKFSRKDVGHLSYSDAELVKQNKRVKDDFRRAQRSQAYLRMVEQRQKLPAWDMKEKILKVLKNNQVMVISGMTGCGKTTQVPQFILEEHLQSSSLKMCSVVCTQPRRISALSVAERVAQERASRVGGLVGYQIRLESRQSASTRLLFCTTGIILRRLEGDARLEGISHIIIDEVHERSEDSDFLMMILRKTLPLRPDLKVILMSATMNANLFSQYFNGCPVIEIPGRTYPVEQFFLEDVIEFTRYVIEESSPFARSLKRTNAVRMGGQVKGGRLSMEEINEEVELAVFDNSGEPPRDKLKDMNLSVKELFMRYSCASKSAVKTMAMMDFEKINYDLIVELLEWIVQGRHEYPKDGAILVFLPGFAEIQTLYDSLLSNSFFSHRGKTRFKIIPLHSTLSSEDQQAVFVKPKEGVRKIVIATNIAETSITIDDVVFVIDSGRMKEKRYDATKSMESLETVWVSQANALQRRGRAGRVTSGVCFHLFTSHQFQHHLAAQPVPEIQRVPLEKLILKIKMLEVFEGNNVEEVIENLLEPPKEESVASSMRRLQDLGALDERSELTSLGYHLGSLPVDVRVGKLMLFGAIFRCLDSALTIAATLSFKSPFVAPFDKKDEADKKRKEFAVGSSDHLSMLNAYNAYMTSKQNGSHASYNFCQENFLSIKTLQMLSSLKQQFVELLSDIGFVQESLTLRDVERAARTDRRDGVVAATGSEANSNSSNLKLVAAILVGALYPNVVQVLTPEMRYSMASSGAVPKAPKPEEMKFKTKNDGYVSIHPSSVNFQVRHYESPFLVYHEKVKTSKIYIRDCTMVSVYPLLLFGGGSISVDLHRGNFVLSVDDGWIRFQVASVEVGELVRELRMELDELLADKINNPNVDLAVCPRGSRIISAIVKLVTTQ